MSDKKVGSGNATKKKGGKIVAGICCAVAIAGIAYFAGVSQNEAEKEKEKRNVVVTQDNLDEVLEEMGNSDYVPFGSYEVSMNFDWVFEDGASASENAYVKNVVANKNDVYFDIYLADTNERIYASPILPRGSHIEAITLDKDLDAGTYDCVIKYCSVDEEQNVLGTVSLSLKIIVEN